MARHKKYQAVAQATIPGTRPKAYNPEWTTSVSVPLAWSAILAGATAILALAGTAALQVLTSRPWPWWSPVAVGALVFALVLCWRVWTSEGDRRRLLLWPIEELTGEDLDRDDRVGEPGPARHDPPRLIYVNRDPDQGQRQEAEDFRAFLRLSYGERGPTRGAWVGQRLPSGRRMTRPQWERYTERLIRSRLAARPYDTAPLTLIGDYRTALATFRELL